MAASESTKPLPGQAAEIDVHVVQRKDSSDLELPHYATSGSAGLDLRAAVPEDRSLAPGERAAIPTGLRFAIPGGWEGQVRPRSGLALRSGLTLINAPGTIDSDYRGEVDVLVVNLSQETVVIRRGDRIAQLVFAPVARASLIGVRRLEETERGGGGFGSTGTS